MTNTKMLNDLLAAEKILHEYDGVCGIDRNRIHLLSDEFFKIFDWKDVSIENRPDDMVAYYAHVGVVQFFCLDKPGLTAKEVWERKLNAILQELQDSTEDFQMRIEAIMEDRPNDDSRISEAEGAEADRAC